jgi:hypothetical protein
MGKIRSARFLGIGLAVFILGFTLGVLPALAVDDGAKLAEQFLK